MPNVLLVYGGTATSFEEAMSGKPGGNTYYTIMYVVLKNDVDLDWMKLGMSLKDMLDGSVIEHGEVTAPDGLARDQFSQGSEAIVSLKRALEVACAALANPSSLIRIKGFAPDTPIFFWRDGKPAQSMDCKME